VKLLFFLLFVFFILMAWEYFFFFYTYIFLKDCFFFRFRLKKVWLSGLTIYLLIIAEAFIGYAMVWAQISYWACVVITSLIIVIPIWGNILVNWIWNSFNIWNATLKILFIFHFLIPFLILILIIIHLIFLHERGRSSSIFRFDGSLKITFFKLYWLKDSLNLIFWLIFLFLSFLFPFKLGDPEIFIDVDLNISPVHIVPEWYFLFAYAILRAIPNKILGVVALIFSIFVFYYFSFLKRLKTPLNKFNKTFLYFFILIGTILRWLGQCFVETPFPFLRSLFSFLYFLVVLFIILNVFFLELSRHGCLINHWPCRRIRATQQRRHS